jgi:hypothetical protein
VVYREPSPEFSSIEKTLLQRKFLGRYKGKERYFCGWSVHPFFIFDVGISQQRMYVGNNKNI